MYAYSRLWWSHFLLQPYHPDWHELFLWDRHERDEKMKQVANWKTTQLQFVSQVLGWSVVASHLSIMFDWHWIAGIFAVRTVYYIIQW
jgi:hypothetical protein